MNIIKKLQKNQNGTVVKFSGTKGRLLNVGNGEKFLFEPESGDNCKVLSTENVISMFGKKLIAVDDRQPLVDLLPMTPQSIKELTRRKAYVSKHVQVRRDNKIGGVKFLADMTKLVAKEINDPFPPCRTALIEWLKIAKISVAGVKATLPKRRKKRKSVFDEEVLDLALEYIDDLYLRLSKPTMQSVYDLYIDHINEFVGKKIKRPGYRTFTDYIKQTPTQDIILGRDGKKALKAAKRNKTSMLITDHILERVEVDAVHFSMGAIDEEGNYLGKVVVYFVIDCYSRSILGFQLQIGTGETASSVIDSYRNAILQKDPSIKCPHVKNDWPMCGISEIVVSDGGPGYTSDAAVQFLNNLDITWQVAQTGCGWRKPYIERFFSTIRKQLLQRMSGYCKRVKDPRELDLSLQKQACYTPAQIESLLTEWIVDEYHQAGHKGLGGKTPQEVWESQSAMYVILPANEDELRLQQGEFVYRKISGNSSEAGIVNNKIRYNDVGGRLQEIGNMKKAKGGPAMIQIQFNLNDISRVTALDEETGEILELTAVDPGITEGMTLVEYNTLNPSVGYNNKGYGHKRLSKDNAILKSTKAIHDEKMAASRTTRPRGANITTTENTEPAETTDTVTDGSTTSSERKLRTVKAHKDA